MGIMNRVALLCLLALTACKSGDPSGTIQPNEKGLTEIVDVTTGDSVPFRLTGGDMKVLYVSSVDSNMASGCDTSMTLTPYGAQGGVSIPITAAGVGQSRLNAIKAGVYFIKVEAKYNYCKYSVLFSKP